MAAKLVKTKTPGVYKRGSRYVFRYRVNGIQRWESCRTLDEARRAKQARHTDIARGEFEERSRITLHEYAREWVERHQGRGRRGFREGTRDEYRRQIEQYVCSHFPERLKLTELTPRKIAGFVGWLCDGTEQAKLEHRLAVERARKDGKPEPKPLSEDAERSLSDATVRNIMAPLRACLATAVREGAIRSNPARDIDLPHRPTAEDSEHEDVRAMSEAELTTLFGLIPERHRLFFRFLAATGLRISEAIALQWRLLHLDGSKPHVKVRRALVKGRMGPPKSKQGRREVPLDHALVLALREHRKDSEWRDEDHPVFAAGNGSPLSPGNVFHRVLVPAREEACLEWVGFHAFRHTCASMLFAQGRNAVQVQRWLGHHSAAFTLARYVHLLDGDLGPPLVVGLSADDDAAMPQESEVELAEGSGDSSRTGASNGHDRAAGRVIREADRDLVAAVDQPYGEPEHGPR
jgi:integrase